MTAGRGDRIAASILLRSWHRLRALRFPRQHPLHWLRALHVRPSANRSAASWCSLHVRVVDCSHGDRFGKSAAESTKLCSMSRRQAAAMPAACLALRPPRATGIATPNPQVWVRCLCFSGPQECNISPMLLHPPRRGPGTAAPSSPRQHPRPSERSRDAGHLPFTPAPAIVQSNKLQNLPSLF